MDTHLKTMPRIEHVIEKISRKIKKSLIKYSSNPRPTSHPFISGDGFRSMAQHVFEVHGANVDADKISEGDIVFVQSDMLVDFFDTVHPKIGNRYILITHNGDRNISEEDIELMDDKIIHWFAQNPLIEHPKVTPIPIGLENAHYWHAGKISLYKNAAIEKNKNGRILVAFSVATNKAVRQNVLNELRKNPLADIVSEKLTQKEYVRLLNAYSYVASPPGNGIDCHRTWEALCVGTVPLIADNYLSNHFKKLGVPLIAVNSWENVPPDKDRPVIQGQVDQVKFDYWKDAVYKHKK
jgi:hypothetical protein